MRLIARVGEWFDARLQIAAPIRDAVEHPVPKNTASWWYVFGSAALVVFALQLVTGILLALDSGLASTMATIGLEAFPAALVGGLDSLVGAVVGSLIVAAAEVLLIHYVDPLLSDVVPFLVLIAMLIVRPWGLFGTREELDRV